jgi:hypothetical protein
MRKPTESTFKKIIIKKISFAFLMLIACQCLSSTTLKIAEIKTAPVIDGKLGKAEWNSAACASAFIDTRQNWPFQQTTAYIALKGKYLYFAFKCQIDDMKKLKTNKYKNDSVRIFSEDPVELFLAPDANSPTYYHLAFNAAGSIYTAKCGSKREPAWNPELKSAVGKSNDCWILECRLPLKEIVAKNVIGQKWRVNFCRNDSALKQPSSWTGQNDFNDKTQMGYAEIAEKPFGDLPFESLNTIDGFQVCLINPHNKPSEFIVTLLCNNKQYKYPYLLKVGESRRASIKLPTSKDKKLTIKISGNNFNFHKAAFLPYHKGFTITPDFYYLPLATKKLKVKIDNDIRNSAKVKIILRSSGKTLSEKEIGASVPESEFDISNLPSGRHVLSAFLLDGKGQKIAEDDKVFFTGKKPKLSKLPEKQNFSIKNSLIFMNDKPFFPFMISALKKTPIVSNCFNVRYGNSGNKKHARPRAGCAIASLRRKPFTLYVLANDATIRSKIEKIPNRNAFVNIRYEAQIPLFSSSSGGLKKLKSNTEYTKINKLIKQHSPKTLTSIQTDRLIKVKYFSDCADIIEVASYYSSYAKNPIRNMSKDIQNAKTQAGNKPMLWWLGAAIPSPKFRNAENIRGATYLALMNNVNGIIYHNGHGGVPLSRTRFWSVFNELSHEVEILYPIIMFGKKNKSKLAQSKDSALSYIVRQQKSVNYVIAVNNSAETVSGNFTLPAELHNGTAKVLFEDRVIKIKNNKITDEFTPYEPHVYVFSK